MNKCLLANLTCLFLIFTEISLGQQLPIFTLNDQASIMYNPAQAGFRGFNKGSILLQHRNQWLNVDGAPKTTFGGGEVSLLEEQLGVAAFLLSETIGLESRLAFTASSAYRIRLEDGFLSGGLQFGFENFSSRLTQAKNISPGDPVYSKPDVSINSGSIGLGVYYHRDQFFVGLSMPGLYTIQFDEGESLKKPHLFFQVGGVFGDIEDSWSYHPRLWVNYQNVAGGQISLGSWFRYRNTYGVGLFFRAEDAVSLALEYQFDQTLQFFISYDLTLSSLNTYSSGSLDLGISYVFSVPEKNPRKRRIKYRKFR